MILQKYDSYKNSGLGWIVKIPEGWRKCRFKDISLIQTSNVDKKSKEDEKEVLLCNYVDVYKNEFIDNSFDFMKATAPKEQISNFSLLKNDVIITKDSETSEDMAEPALVIENLNNVICGYHLALIRSKKFIENRFIFRLFQAPSFHWNFIIKSKGVTRVGLSINNAVKNQELFFPNKQEQTKISNFLDKKTSQIDSKIKLLQEKIASYEELKKSVINDIICKGLNKDVELKDSEIEWIRKIPKHWKVERLKNFVYLKGRIGWKALKNEEYIDEGYALLTSYNLIKSKKFVNFYNKTNYIPKWRYDESPEIMIQKNDILMSKIEGRIGYVKELEQEATINSSLMLIRTNNENILKSMFLFYILDSNSFLHYFNINQNGSAMQSISQEDVNYFKFPFHPKEKQIQIANYLDEKTTKIDHIVSKIKDQVETLKEFRKTLINDIVTGKVRAPE